MKKFKNLKTSDRISLSFALVNLLSLIVLLVSINIIYFFIWYEDQKAESLYDMNMNYDAYKKTFSDNKMDAFKNYILEKDTIIIPEEGSTICSDGVGKKIHDDKYELAKLENSYFYKQDGKIFFIFSQTYEELGEVKVLFDTTSYIKSQIIIVKISLIIIAISLFMSYIAGKLFSRYTLRDLKKISTEAKNINIDNFHAVHCDGCEEDEVKILANTINASFLKIKGQTENLKQFITDVSHEFKTPLMVINSKIDLYNKKVEKNKISEGDMKNLLVSIKNNTSKLNKLLETLFLLSRKVEGIETFEKEEVELGKHLKCYIDDLVSTYSDKSIEVQYDFSEPVNKCIDKTTFNIIIENLITNAIKFSGKSISLNIRLDKSGFSIQDNGRGIKKDELENIWNKFFRADTKIEGFGVGLYIVKRILDLYTWEVIVKSEVGKGTEFRINF